MIHIHQPFFSISASAIFGALGLGYAIDAVHNVPTTIAGVALGTPEAWALSGLLLLMAYFSLVHLTD